ncbi:MAG: ketosteroid isomerase-like protein [Hyphomicrobiaceae bacterium]|jgi:ketosteroid isomerase-like protein
MNNADATAIMGRFGKAFFKADRDALAEILTPDAQWHFAIGPDAPHGRVRTGVNGFIEGNRENREDFPSLRFVDVVCRGLDDNALVMTYRLEGERRDGTAIDLRGIELVTLRDGRIALKDVFWKQSPQ